MSDEKNAWIPDVTDDRERQRIGPAGLRIFFNIAARWCLTDTEASRLLALEGESNVSQLKLNPPPDIFTEDCIFRISYLIGIYKGLHICYGDSLADRWIKLQNRNPLFGGITPLEYMTSGGRRAMQAVRRLIDARSLGY